MRLHSSSALPPRHLTAILLLVSTRRDPPSFITLPSSKVKLPAARTSSSSLVRALHITLKRSIQTCCWKHSPCTSLSIFFVSCHDQPCSTRVTCRLLNETGYSHVNFSTLRTFIVFSSLSKLLFFFCSRRVRRGVTQGKNVQSITLNWRRRDDCSCHSPFKFSLFLSRLQ